MEHSEEIPIVVPSIDKLLELWEATPEHLGLSPSAKGKNPDNFQTVYGYIFVMYTSAIGNHIDTFRISPVRGIDYMNGLLKHLETAGLTNPTPKTFAELKKQIHQLGSEASKYCTNTPLSL